MNINELICGNIQQSINVKQNIFVDRAFVSLIARVAGAAVRVLRSGHKIMLAGNGGSAADAQHLAGELVNRLRFDRPALAAIALSTDTSVLTSVANDSSFDNIFARQIEALGVRGDMFLGISTSGSSSNILRAFAKCRERKIIGVGLTGQKSARMAKLCDYCLVVPSADTPRVQETHIMIGHILCEIVEAALFKGH